MPFDDESYPKVLVVDDCEVNRKLLATILKSKGNLYFELASDGQEALEKMNETTFNLVLMDVRMPVMDGFETVSAIRHHWPERNTPVVAVTASTADLKTDRFRSAGFTDQLLKPFAIRDIDNLLSRYTYHTS